MGNKVQCLKNNNKKLQYHKIILKKINQSKMVTRNMKVFKIRVVSRSDKAKMGLEVRPCEGDLEA